MSDFSPAMTDCARSCTQRMDLSGFVRQTLRMSADLGPEDPLRLGPLMDRRRGHLRLSWAKVAELAGVSRSTLNDISNGRIGDIRSATKTGIDHALKWEPGDGVDAILAGREPTPARGDERPAPTLNTVRDLGGPQRRREATPDDVLTTLQVTRERYPDDDPLFWKTLGIVNDLHNPYLRETRGPDGAAEDDRSA